jgi:ankyrin repeat protein
MAKYGFLKFLKSMSSSKINLNSKDYDDRTALHIAAANDNLEVMGYFME